MLFVPIRKTQEAYIIEQNFSFDIDGMYFELGLLKDKDGSKLFKDPTNDYGGLSIIVSPYENMKNKNPQLTFDSPVFFMVTIDELTLYIGYVQERVYIFDSYYRRLN